MFMHFERAILALTICLLAALVGASPQALAANDVQILITVANDSEKEGALFRDMQRSGAVYSQYEINHRATAVLRRIARKYALAEPEASWQVDSLGEYCAVYSLGGSSDVEDLLDEIRSDPEVASVQRMVTYRAASLSAASPVRTPADKRDGSADLAQERLRATNLTYNDPYFERQYAESTAAVEDMHRLSRGSGVTIGLIDTIVDRKHADFKGLTLRTKSTVPRGISTSRDMTHGTAMLGVIAAQPANGTGVVGLAPAAEVLSLGACWYPLESGTAVCNSLSIAAALDLALQESVDIINMSLAGPRDPLVERVINKVLARGALVIASDPLEGENRFPAKLPGVVAVSNVKPAREDANSSSGVDNAELSSIRKADAWNASIATGELLSTAPFGTYDFYTGASVSSAFATGLVALYLSGDRGDTLKKTFAEELSRFHFEYQVD